MKAGDCKHYRSMFHHDTCKADVRYEDLVPSRRGRFLQLPCIGKGAVACEKREAVTVDEVESWEQDVSNSLVATMKIREAITASFDENAESHAGTIVCPLCGSAVNYRYSSVNGHIHAACTGGCASWME